MTCSNPGNNIRESRTSSSRIHSPDDTSDSRKHKQQSSNSWSTPTDAGECRGASVRKAWAAQSLAATIAAFFDSLESKDLLDTPAVRERLGSRQQVQTSESSILYKQVASFNPETDLRLAAAAHAMGVHAGISGVRVLSHPDAASRSFSLELGAIESARLRIS